MGNSSQPAVDVSTGSAPALSVEGLRFSYPETQQVLQGVDLTVQPGEKVGLIGPNGTGKTTLFLLISGILKPEAGRILLYSKPVVPGQFRPEIGLVFQNADDQLFSPTVGDDVAFGPQNLGLSEAEVQARVADALATTGTLDLVDRTPHHLSGGQKRMVSIAGVLAMQPRLVVYDEPSASLDMRSRRRLIEFLQASSGSILIASHDLELILEVCDRAVLMDEGQVIVDGDPRQVMVDAVLMEAHGLEKPHSLVPHTNSHHAR